MNIIHSQIADLVSKKYNNAVIKKLGQDNFLDIHLPSVNEKKGTHLFFNTSGGKIKLGFYCRDEEFVKKVLATSNQIEEYSQGVRPLGNPEFDSIDAVTEAAFNFVENLINSDIQKNKSVPTTPLPETKPSEIPKEPKNEIKSEENDHDSENEEDKGGYPMISYRKPAEGMAEVVKKYLGRWQKSSQVYAWRMGIKAYIPEFVGDLVSDKTCPIFSTKEIKAICSRIKSEKIIPILDYVPVELFSYTNEVWWLVPFCIWKENVASLVFVDKNGFYAMFSKDGVEEIVPIFSWESVDELCVEYKYDGDPNINRLILTQENGGYLTLDEFVSTSKLADHGSYLAVIEAIWEVREETIKASKGEHFWHEGTGGEGFVEFETPQDLLESSNWENPYRPDPGIY